MKKQKLTVYEKLIKSLKDNGQLTPVLITKEFGVLDGWKRKNSGVPVEEREVAVRDANDFVAKFLDSQSMAMTREEKIDYVKQRGRIWIEMRTMVGQGVFSSEQVVAMLMKSTGMSARTIYRYLPEDVKHSYEICHLAKKEREEEKAKYREELDLIPRNIRRMRRDKLIEQLKLLTQSQPLAENEAKELKSILELSDYANTTATSATNHYEMIDNIANWLDQRKQDSEEFYYEMSDEEKLALFTLLDILKKRLGDVA